MVNQFERKISHWMQTALSVAASGSPVQSAKELGISITTVYRHLDALEQSLEFKIFNRRHSGWSLRDEAFVLLETGRKIEALLVDAQSEIRNAAALEYGDLRIAVSDGFAAYYVARHLPSFCQENSRIKPELVVSSEFSNLVHGQADVAIRPDMDPGDTLVGQRIGRMNHAFYASRDYIRQYGSPSSQSDLDTHKICGYGASLQGFTAAQWLDDHVDAEAIIARFGASTAMVQAIIEGVGIGLLPCFIGDSFPSLSAVMTIDGGLPVDIWLVSASATKKRPKTQAFFKYFASAMRKDRLKFIGRPYRR